MQTRAWILALATATVLTAAGQEWRGQGVLHLDRSPYARLHPVPVGAVRWGEGFWSERRAVNAGKSIPVLLELLEEHGVVDNFRRLSGRKQVARRGPLYTDSDLYKWMEAAAFVLQSEERPELLARLNAMVDEVLAAQEPEGYLNTYYTGERRKLRFQEMQRGHELYCLGHLLQAGIALYRANGDRRLLEGGIRFVEYLLAGFGPGKRPLLTGHPELELALVELYRITRRPEHLNLARYLLEGDERLKLQESEMRYMFSGKPFLSRTRMEGHAVRALYALSGAADYYLESGGAAYRKTLLALWDDMAQRKLYITGGAGARAQGEAFGEAYELPNAQAYTESCAAIANLMWNWRLLAATGEARFADVMERALYNGINSGMSLDGTLYCYRNPLESDRERIRNPWYNTTCCPPNLQRTLASLPGYLYSTSREGVWVHLYHDSLLRWRLEDGTPLELAQRTRYPWSGRVEIEPAPERPRRFTLFLRVPGWSRKATVAVNGEAAQAVRPGEYAALRREWKRGDRVRLELDLAPRFTAANPRVAENYGKVAVERGPLVYCLEEQDQPAGVSVFDVALPGGAPRFRAEERREFHGITVLKHDGFAWTPGLESEPLYGPAGEAAARGRRTVELTFIPYYAWANRGPSRMRVWIPVVSARQ